MAQNASSAGTAQIVSSEADRQANNPIANLKAISLQNYYSTSVSQSPADVNTFFLRYAQPLTVGPTKWLVRASLPVLRVSANTQTNSGLGDFNVFGTYLFDLGNPNLSVGAGPFLVAPTTTGNVPTADEWQLGAAGVYFDGRNDRFQYGGLVTFQTNVSGSTDTSVLAFQPFELFQLGSGLYLRSVGIWTFDLTNGNYNVPIGFGIGKVIQEGSMVFNAYLEPQATILSHGANQPNFQILAGFNIQIRN